VHIRSDSRALGSEGGGQGGRAVVLCPAGVGERNGRNEHLTVWLVSQRVLWLL